MAILPWRERATEDGDAAPPPAAATARGAAALREDAPAAVVDDATRVAAEAPPPVVTEIRFATVAHFPRDESEGLPEQERPGAGRVAVVAGVVRVDGNTSAGARIEIVAGLNAGALATTSGRGEFRIEGLFEGAGIAEITTRGGIVARRRLDAQRRTRGAASIRLTTPGELRGAVVDEAGTRIPNAAVAIDGHSARTAADGTFFFPSISGGEALVTTTAAGFESRRDAILLRQGPGRSLLPIEMVLRRGATLRVALERAAPGEEPPLAVLLPDSATSGADFPFESRGLAVAGEDGFATFEGLPLGESFHVLGFSQRGVARPSGVTVSPSAGEPLPALEMRFPWQWPVEGRLLVAGEPVAGASVRIESADVGRATERALRSHGGHLATPVPILPFARRATRTDTSGWFRIEGAPVHRPAWIVISTPETLDTVLRLPDHGSVDLGTIELDPRRAAPRADLVVRFERGERRSVTVRVDGEARLERVLGPGETLRTEALLPHGSYVLDVTDGAARLRSEERLVRASPVEVVVP